MIKDIEINNFRCFDRLKVADVYGYNCREKLYFHNPSIAWLVLKSAPSLLQTITG
jgi:hypothetical protein